jgi:hypothetical protein
MSEITSANIFYQKSDKSSLNKIKIKFIKTILIVFLPNLSSFVSLN